MPRGGERKGAGRPVGSKIKNPKVQVAARVCPTVAAWLEEKKKQGKNKSKIIEAALIEYKEQMGE